MCSAHRARVNGVKFRKQSCFFPSLIAVALVLVFGSAKFQQASFDSKHRVSIPEIKGAWKSSAAVRARRRAYEGAPPVIPHRPFGASCISCHTAEGIAVSGEGFAPPSPHGKTQGMGKMSRCQQCHVFVNTQELFTENNFSGLRQDLRHGNRLNPFAPPVIPHALFMREDCLACHSGLAAREEIRTSHSERQRCLQCHLPRVERMEFSRAGSTASPQEVSTAQPEFKHS